MRPDVRPSVAIHVLFVLFGVVIAAFFPFFALVMKDRGLSPGQIGIVVAAMAAARTVANPVWGHLADTRFGRRRTLRLASAGTAVSGLLLWAYGDSLVSVVVLTVVVAAWSCTTGPNLDALALAHLGRDDMADYGRIRGWESLSYAAACLGLGVLLQAAGVRWALLIYALGSMLVVAWGSVVEPDPPGHVQEHGRLGAVGAVFRAAPRFWLFLAGSLLLWTGFTGAWNFLALRIESRGGGPLLVGIGTALGGAIEVPVMRASSRLQRRFGLRSVYAAGAVVYGVGFLLWGLVDSAVVVSGLTMLEGVGFALLFTSGVVIVGRLVPPALQATGQSMVTAVGFGVAPIIGGAVAGFVYEHLGATTLYSGASVLALAGGATVWASLSAPGFRRPTEAVADPEGGSARGRS